MIRNDKNNKELFNDEWKLFFNHLRITGYSATTIKSAKYAAEIFVRFLEQTNTKYSNELSEIFLVEASRIYCKSTVKLLNTTLNKFDLFRNGERLTKRNKQLKIGCPKRFNNIFSEYTDYLINCDYKLKTIDDYTFNLIKILNKFDELEIKNISDITVKDVYSLSTIKNRKKSFFTVLRKFLQYLYENKYLTEDYSYFAPSFRYSRPVPSVYSKNEIRAILSSVDRETPIGKRNYAIILLALRLGIRSGDIVKLKFDDIDFSNKKIFVIQEKTGVSQSLELLPEIENAIIDYTTNSRPDFEIPYIFLTVIAPIRVLTSGALYSCVSQYITNAKIDVGDRKKGAHALRMTFASELVSEKVPYNVVRKILGHEDPLTIKHYVAFDNNSLRTCALKVPFPTGNLAEYINSRMGVDANDLHL